MTDNLYLPESSSAVQVLGQGLSLVLMIQDHALPCVVWGSLCVGMLSHILDTHESFLLVVVVHSLDYGTNSDAAEVAASDGMTDHTDHTDMVFDLYVSTCETPDVSEIWKRTDTGHIWNTFLLHVTYYESGNIKWNMQ